MAVALQKDKDVVNTAFIVAQDGTAALCKSELLLTALADLRARTGEESDTEESEADSQRRLKCAIGLGDVRAALGYVGTAELVQAAGAGDSLLHRCNADRVLCVYLLQTFTVW